MGPKIELVASKLQNGLRCPKLEMDAPALSGNDKPVDTEPHNSWLPSWRKSKARTMKVSSASDKSKPRLPCS
jgi:hypothetical protein